MADSDSSHSMNQVSDTSSGTQEPDDLNKEQSTISYLSPLSSEPVKDDSPQKLPFPGPLAEDSGNEDQELMSQPPGVITDSASEQSLAITEMYKQTKTTISPERRAALQALYQKHGSNQSALWYSAQTDIPRITMSKFITFMEHGLDLCNLSYRIPRKTGIAKVAKASPTPSSKGFRPEFFSMASPIQLNTVQTNLGSAILNRELSNIVLERKDELVKRTAEDTGKTTESRKKQRNAKRSGVGPKEHIQKDRTLRQRHKQLEPQLDKVSKTGVLETTSHTLMRNRVETEQLRRNREDNRELLSNQITFIRIEHSPNLTSEAISELSDQEAKHVQIDFVERYRRALVEGRTAMFVSDDHYNMYLGGLESPIALSLLSLVSSDGDMFCELFLGLVSKEVIKKWVMHVLQMQFSDKAPLIIADHEVLSVLPNTLPSITYSHVLERLSPVRHMTEIWEQRVKFYGLLNTSQTVEHLMDQFSTEFLTLPQTSLLGKLAEIREHVWWNLYNPT